MQILSRKFVKVFLSKGFRWKKVLSGYIVEMSTIFFNDRHNV